MSYNTLFTSNGVFVFFSFFFPGRYFSSVGHRGGTTDCFLQFLPLFFLFFSFDLSTWYLVSIRLFPFVSLFHRMCMSWLSYLVPGIMTWHCIACYCCAYCIHTWQRSIFVVQLCEHRTCVSPRIEESARILVVPDVDGQREQNTHS